MPVDASIPLQIAIPQPPDLLGTAAKGLQIQGMQQEIQQRQLQMEQQQAEAEAFKGADFSTPEGRNQVLVNVMQKAPQAGIGLMKTFGELDKNAAQAKHYVSQAALDDLKVHQGKQQALANAALPAWNAYQEALKQGKPDQVARAEADKLMPQALSSIQDSGQFSSDEVAQMPRTFDPIKVGSALMSAGTYSKLITDRLHEAQAGSAEATTKLREEQAAHPEKFRQQNRSSTKEVIQEEGGGLGIIDKDNPEAGVTDIPGSKGAHKPGTGGGAAAQKANVRAATVAASANNSLRLLNSIKEEFGDDATTSAIYGQQPEGLVGKLAQAAEKKVIPAKSQKLDARANSFIDEAGPAFTGGLRVNSSFRTYLMHQLPQFGDPPEVAKEKWKNFKDNISGASDTFKKAYSGNPDYWSKDDKGTLVSNPDDYVKAGSPPKEESSGSKPLPMPKVGDVVNGYTFQGGDPHQQSSWKKAGGQ